MLFIFFFFYDDRKCLAFLEHWSLNAWLLAWIVVTFSKFKKMKMKMKQKIVCPPPPPPPDSMQFFFFFFLFEFWNKTIRTNSSHLDRHWKVALLQCLNDRTCSQKDFFCVCVCEWVWGRIEELKQKNVVFLHFRNFVCVCVWGGGGKEGRRTSCALPPPIVSSVVVIQEAKTFLFFLLNLLNLWRTHCRKKIKEFKCQQCQSHPLNQSSTFSFDFF